MLLIAKLPANFATPYSVIVTDYILCQRYHRDDIELHYLCGRTAYRWLEILTAIVNRCVKPS